jgi:hypothetical protein
MKKMNEQTLKFLRDSDAQLGFRWNYLDVSRKLSKNFHWREHFSTPNSFQANYRDTIQRAIHS